MIPIDEQKYFCRGVLFKAPVLNSKTLPYLQCHPSHPNHPIDCHRYRRRGTWRVVPWLGPTAGAATSPRSAAASRPRFSHCQVGATSPSKMGRPWKYI